MLAADLIKDICEREKVSEDGVTLHSDNGSPMKGATMLATLERLGVAPSFSRPSVSNDNPYSESLFRTPKYRQNYPEKSFSDLTKAREWVGEFVDGYNNEHLHSGIKFVTPVQRHNVEDADSLKKRTEVYMEAKSRNPNRWSGDIRNWSWVDKVYLNPEKCKTSLKENKTA
ncbi:MAG: integrase core domain-containing protein [Cellvibrionaceae bacterium]|nr:integrase core domain-containing protein [Cellvibrionaceae bacterium]